MRLTIKHSMKLVLALGATALAIAGCGGSDDEAGGNAAAASPGIVSVASVGGMEVLEDSGGRTLYTAAAEQGGRIRCVDACTSFWKPLLGSRSDARAEAAELREDIGVVTRPSGDRQLTFDGLPLYTFTEEDPGKLDGDGFVDEFQGTHFEWAAARTAAGSDAPASNGAGGGY